MPNTGYKLPVFLERVISPQVYRRWLHRKAQAHVRRDRGRGRDVSGVSAYKLAIHRAVLRSKGVDAYTGEPLDWRLISTYSNEESKEKRHKLKARLAKMPTVDHLRAGGSHPAFRICGWAVNDSKHDMSVATFVALCRRVVNHCHLKRRGG